MDEKWRICLLDTKEQNPNHYIVLAIEAALKDHDQVELVNCPPYVDALSVAVRDRCNLFLAFDGEGLDRGLCRRLAAVCGTSACWMTEDPYERHVNVQNAGLFDFVFTNDSYSVGSYPSGAHHLPLAADPRFNFHEIPSLDDSHYLYDVLFVGTAWPNRVQFLKELLSRSRGLKFKIGLQGNEHLPVPDLDLPPSTYLWRVPNSEMARLANRSRVVLTLHRDFSGSGCPSRAATPGPRLFEMALAGGFQLVDLSVAETSAYFRLDHEIAGFHSVEECSERLDHFLSEPATRLAFARAAQERCLAEHLYQHRVDRLLRIVSAGGSRPHPAAVSRRQARTRIMYVTHNVVDVRPFGGVEVYVDELVRHLPEQYEPFLYYPDRRYPLGQVMVCENVCTGEKTRKVLGGPIDDGSLQDTERESLFAEILHDRRIDIVHFQHLIGHPWSLPLVPRTLGLPVVATFSDHLPVCSHFNLIHSSGRYCNVPVLPATACDFCLAEHDRIRAGSQASRRAFIAGVLPNLDLVIFLSANARAIAQAVYPSLARSDRVWVEGLPISDRRKAPDRTLGGRSLKAVVLGNFDHVKGGDALCKVLNSMREDEIEFHVHGHVRPPYDDILRALAVPNVHVHGAYEPGSLHQALARADIGLFLSLWPETYLLTLSEAWNAGVVPIVTDIGAPGSAWRTESMDSKCPSTSRPAW